MPTQVQLRGGSSTENNSFTGAVREVTVDTSNNSLRIHDGSTAGGHRLLTVREFTANIDHQGTYLQANNILTAGLAVKNDNHVYTVTVGTKTGIHPFQGGSSSAYFIDGEEAPHILLAPGITYLFDQSDSTNATHPLRFYTDAGKTTSYTTGVTTNGTAGSAGAFTKIIPDANTSSVLYYQCSSHGYMGAGVSVVNGANPAYYQTANALSNLANTNSFIKSQLANTNSYINSNLANTNAFIKSQLANTNSAIADRMQVANTTLLVNDRMQVTNVNTLVNDRMQVANATSLINDRIQVANATLLINDRMQVANTTLLVNDRLQVANAKIINLKDVVQGTTPTNGQILKYASGNSTFYFASESGGGGGSSSLTGLNDVVQGVSPTNNQILKFNAANSTFIFAADSTGSGSGEVSNSYLTSTFTTNTAFQSALSNTNSFIKSQLANTNSFIGTKLDSSSYTEADVRSKAALANTNAFIATKLDSSSYTTADVRSKAALANTNTAIADRLQVANAVTTVGSLTDVVQGVTPSDNYILKYNSANTTWLFEADASGGGNSFGNITVDNKVTTNAVSANTFSGKNITVPLSGDSTTLVLDLFKSNIFTVTLSANVTNVTANNSPASGTPTMFMLKVNYSDSTTRTITWGSEFEWPNGTTPTLSCTTGTSDFFTFYTDNNSSNVYSFTSGLKLY